jgi:hypothetical protein
LNILYVIHSPLDTLAKSGPISLLLPCQRRFASISSFSSVQMATVWHANPLPEIEDDDIIESRDPSELVVTPRDLHEFVPIGRVSHIPPFDTPPKKVQSSSGKLTVGIDIQRTMFVSNGQVEGQLTISCSKEGLEKIGKVVVYLLGYEGKVVDTGS